MTQMEQIHADMDLRCSHFDVGVILKKPPAG
jgi:hypothetical protein